FRVFRFRWNQNRSLVFVYAFSSLEPYPLRPKTLPTSDPEQLAGVGLQHLWPDLVTDVELGEIGEPAIGRDHRPVRTEQHLILQYAVDIAHQDRREIFRRPAREVNVDIGLV